MCRATGSRNILLLAGLLLVALTVIQCAPAATPGVREVPVTVEVTKVVEKEVTAIPTKEVVVIGPTPEATGLPEYQAPAGGIVEEIKRRGVLRNGVECQVRPAEFYDPETGECIGYDIDIARRIAARLGVRLEVIDTAWAGVIPSLYTGDFDMICSMMTIREARKKAVNFSRPYGCDQVEWIVRKGDDRIQTPKDLDGMVVATQLNSAAEAQAIELEKELGIKYKELKSFDHFDGAYMAVRTGQADIATSTAWNDMALFEAQPGVFDVALYFPIYNYVGIATRKQDTDLAALIDQVLEEMIASGELADLQYKWYGYAFRCGEEGPNPPDGWKPPSKK